jgi:hypothetical protein
MAGTGVDPKWITDLISTSEEIRSDAIVALGNLADGHAEIQEEIGQNPLAIMLLLTQFTTNNPDLLEETVRTLSCLAPNTNNAQQMIAFGIPRLVKELENENIETSKYAALTLAYIAMNHPSTTLQMLENGALITLQNRLANGFSVRVGAYPKDHFWHLIANRQLTTTSHFTEPTPFDEKSFVLGLLFFMKAISHDPETAIILSNMRLATGKLALEAFSQTYSPTYHDHTCEQIVYFCNEITKAAALAKKDTAGLPILPSSTTVFAREALPLAGSGSTLDSSSSTSSLDSLNHLG